MEKLFDYLRCCFLRQVFAVAVLALTVPKRSGAAYLFFLCKSMTGSFFFFFFFFLRGSFFIQFRCVLCIECVHPCVTCVYMHMCSNRQCIYVSLQSPLIHHAISAKRMLSFQFFLFLFFSFFADDGVQLCEGVRVHSSCRFLDDAPPLGFCNVCTFFKSGSIKLLEGILCRITLIDTHSITLSQPRFFFSFQLLITQHQCSYIHVLTIFTEPD